MLKKECVSFFIPGALLVAALYVLSQYNYLLFHALAEIFSIVIAWLVFVVGWNARKQIQNNYLILLSIAYLFIGALELLYTLNSRGMEVFPSYGANLSAQLWLATRSLEAVVLLIAPLLIKRKKIQPSILMLFVALASGLLVFTVFGGYFPDCYIEASGPTNCNRFAGYFLGLLLAVAWLLLFRRRFSFQPLVYNLLLTSIALAILGGLSFTFYLSVYGLSNPVGYLAKILSLWCIYKALVQTGINKPRDFLFHELDQSREDLAKKAGFLEKAESLANLGAWEWDLERDMWLLSENWQKIHGLYKSRVSTSELMQLAHPEDASEIKEAFARAMEKGESYDLRHRIQRADDKETRYIHALGEVEFCPETGTPVRMIGAAQDITREKYDQEALRKKEQLLREVALNIPGALYQFRMHKDGTFDFPYMSQGVQEIFGLTPEKAINDAEAIFERVHEEDIAQVRQCITISAQNLEPYSLIHRVRRSDGQIKWIKASSVPMRLEEGSILWNGMAIDVTEQKLTEATLKQREFQLGEAQHIANIGSFIRNAVTGEGIWTDQTYRIFGYEPGEVKPSHRLFREHIHPDDQELVSQKLKLLTTTAPKVDFECRFIRKDGSQGWSRVICNMQFDQMGNPVQAFGTFQDISDLKEHEQLKEDVDRIMRHDLRAPLTGIIGVPQTLQKDKNLTEEQLESLQAVEESGRRMLNKINLSLELFKMETGAYEYVPQQVDVICVIFQLLKQFHSQISLKKLKTEVLVNNEGVTESQEFNIWSRKILLDTLLSNLLENAIQASPEGEKVVIALNNLNSTKISVQNVGAVPIHVRAKFFDKYSTHGKSFGTGLGTYSAKLMAETMKYQISMQTSDEDNFTRVIIDF
jgi:PAS domain S-box-containing protein